MSTLSFDPRNNKFKIEDVGASTETSGTHSTMPRDAMLNTASSRLEFLTSFLKNDSGAEEDRTADNANLPNRVNSPRPNLQPDDKPPADLCETSSSKLIKFIRDECLNFVRDGFVAFNPMYVWRQAKDSFNQMKHARAYNDDEMREDPSKIEGIIRGRLKAALLTSEVVGTYLGSLGLSLYMQYSSGSGHSGIVGTILGDYFPAILTSTLTWAFLNREYYANSGKNILEKTGQLISDRLPVLWNGLKASIPAYGVSYLLSTGVLQGLNALSPGLGDQVPAWFSSEFFNIVFAEAIFLGIVFRGYDRLTDGLVKKYKEHLERT